MIYCENDDDHMQLKRRHDERWFCKLFNVVEELLLEKKICNVRLILSILWCNLMYKVRFLVLKNASKQDWYNKDQSEDQKCRFLTHLAYKLANGADDFEN